MRHYILSAFSDEAGPTLDEQIAALQRNGIHRMEIRSVNGKNISKTPLTTVAEYRKKLDAAGIRVETIGSPIGKYDITEDFAPHREQFLHTLEVAKVLGAKRIRMFSFFTHEENETHRAEVHARLNEMLELAAASGVKLCHENEKDIYGDVDTRVLDLMQVFAGRMEFIFDPANFIQCGCDPAEVYPKVRQHIAYFHIKDALKATGGVVPPGEGDGSLAYLLEDFAKDHTGTILTVEPHLKGFLGLKDDVSVRSEGSARYKDNNESFDAAVTALKGILNKGGLSYE